MIKILLIISSAFALLLSVINIAQHRKIKNLEAGIDEEKVLREVENHINNLICSSRLAIKDKEIRKLRHALKVSDEKRYELCKRINKK